MLAVDANLVVRYLLRDESVQTPGAEKAIRDREILLPLTAAQESFWVLTKMYRLPEREVLTALRRFCALPNVKAQEPEQLAQALIWAETGLDFADALHLAAAKDGEAFLTFDRDLIRAAASTKPPARAMYSAAGTGSRRSPRPRP